MEAATLLDAATHQARSTATAYTSAAALNDLGLRGQKHQADAVLDIVVAAVRNGAKDLSLREIAKRWELAHGRQIDVGTVSARVTNLVDQHRLVRIKEDARACTISGKTVQPVTVPAQQARMF